MSNMIIVEVKLVKRFVVVIIEFCDDIWDSLFNEVIFIFWIVNVLIM